MKANKRMGKQSESAKSFASRNGSEANTENDFENDEVIGAAFRYSLFVAGGITSVLLVGFLIWRFSGDTEVQLQVTEAVVPEKRSAEEVSLPSIPLVDITSESGINWVHESGMEGEKLLPETMGGGIAVWDFDNDGDQDLLFVGGKSWPWASKVNPASRSLALFANDGKAKFSDVTAEVGLDIEMYGMGPSVGDFDNDGWDDLFISAVGENRLFRNVDGKFTDVSEVAKIQGDEEGWSTGATWFDYDNDGLLDLFVCDYVLWNRDLDVSIGFSLTGVGRAYGQPTAFTGANSRLFHNEGNGEFRDVTEAMGIRIVNANTQVPVGKGLAVAAVDVNQDGWSDIVVANDTVQNFLFLNLEGKEFEESGMPMGIAYDRSGSATGAMGLDTGYFRNDESLGISIGNFANEPSSLYVSPGPESPFFEQGMTTGLGPLSRLNLTFGLFFADLDLDARQDLVCANGHLEEEISKVQSTQLYAQSPQFFWNAGPKAKTEFAALTIQEIGAPALERMVGRGAAFGDLDSDGDLDIVLVANSGSPRVLRNDQELGNHWLRLKLVGSNASNRNAYGAKVTLKTADAEQRRVVTPTRSYLSQCETILTFGLGQQTAIESLVIEWPDGSVQEIEPGSEVLNVDRVHEIQQ